MMNPPLELNCLSRHEVIHAIGARKVKVTLGILNHRPHPSVACT